jgi:hypothetical protein
MLRQNGADRSKRSDKIRNNYGHGSKRHFCLLESPISKPPNGPLPLEIQLPGTEFLDAETGGQKSALETADVDRDRKSGDDTGEIPAEAASLESPTKCAVWEDWMVGTTGIEPATPTMKVVLHLLFLGAKTEHLALLPNLPAADDTSQHMTDGLTKDHTG